MGTCIVSIDLIAAMAEGLDKNDKLTLVQKEKILTYALKPLQKEEIFRAEPSLLRPVLRFIFRFLFASFIFIVMSALISIGLQFLEVNFGLPANIAGLLAVLGGAMSMMIILFVFLKRLSFWRESL